MSTQPPQHRRALPIPVETTCRSHRQASTSQQLNDSPLPTNPIESIYALDGADDKSPTEERAKTPGVLPQPVETIKSNRGAVDDNNTQHNSGSDDSIPSTTTEFTTTLDHGNETADRERAKNTHTNIQNEEDQDFTPMPTLAAFTRQSNPTVLSPPRRLRFAPILIETTRRSRKAGDSRPATLPTDKTDLTPGTPNIYTTPSNLLRHATTQGRGRGTALLHPQDTSTGMRSSSLPPPLRPYRQGSMRPHPNTRANTRCGSSGRRAVVVSQSQSTEVDNATSFSSSSASDSSKTVTQYAVTVTAVARTDSLEQSRNESLLSTPSLTGSFTSVTNSQNSSINNVRISSIDSPSRMRESCDERYDGYLLSLAAIAAEEQLNERVLKEKMLREQMELAYTNRDFCYEPVSHWGGDESASEPPSPARGSTLARKASTLDEQRIVEIQPEEDDDSSDISDDDFEGPPAFPHEITSRKESEPAREFTSLPTAVLAAPHPPRGMTLAEIEYHEAELVRLRAEETLRLVAAEATTPSFADPFWTNGQSVKPVALPLLTPVKEAGKEERELKIQREAASPPMLGGDLVFRTCPSPQRTRLETDQRHHVPCPQTKDGGGLWGGYCVPDPGDASPNTERRKVNPMGLLETPAAETPALSARPGMSRMTSAANAHGLHMLHGLDERLQKEVAKKKRQEAIRAEFDDKFVTQVYNYLSLGWPLLAREFDEELAHISGVDQEELRREDEQENGVKGNIGVQEIKWDGAENERTDSEDSGSDEGCGRDARWCALKKYVHEWARQHPDLVGDGNHQDWGVRERRGSWAI